MTYRLPTGDAETVERLEKARIVYAEIFRALQASVQKLHEEGDTVADARHRQDLYRQHLKQLQSVFEIEGSLGTLGSSAAGNRIDLDAARTEIRDRLARIRERGGGGELPDSA